MFFKHNIIGTSAALQNVLALADKMAASAARVLITGETGTGKELIAQYLHASGPRCDKPFIAINCSALPAALLESEVFGHAKGAFTEAHRTHEGLIAAAAGGVLFLDEIADMALPLQAKMLRFLETGEFRKVGSTQLEKADVRIVSATHQSLKHLVSRGAFREDLYYRLAVLTLEMPPLRARPEDIPLLAQYFLLRFSAAENKDFAGVTPEAAALLANYPWPGNIRELQNTLHKITILQNGVALTADMVQEALAPAAPPQMINAVAANVISLRSAPKPLWQIEKEAIDAAISYCRGNIPRAAALLQVSPSTLYRRRGGNTDSADISSP